MAITITNPSGIVSATVRVDTSNVAPLGLGHGKSRVFSGDSAFLDISKSVSFKKPDYSSYDAADLDANGWPVRIPSGSDHCKLFLYANAMSGTIGDYLLRWQSDIELTLTAPVGTTLTNVFWDGQNGTADLTLSGDGEVRFGLSGGGAGDLTGFGGVQVLPKKTFANAGGLTGVQLSDLGRNWNPDYLDLFTIQDVNGRGQRRPFFARYMDMNSVNTITAEQDVTDIKTLAHARWNESIPPELAVEFATYVRPVYSWWCLPKSTDAYQQSVMTTLKGMLANSIPVFENGNERWNSIFKPTGVDWADSVEYFSGQGVSGFFTSVGASITAGSRDITVGTGEGANFSVGDVVSADGVFIGSVGSVAGDVVTVDRGNSLTTGTYNVSTGPYDARYDWHMIQLERIRVNAEAVFASPSDYRTVISAQKGISVQAGYFETPYWLAVDPSRPAPADRHDWFTIASYYPGDLTEAMVATFQTDQAQAVVDFHAAQMTAISTLADQLTSTRTALDVYAPNMPIVPYEGGSHSLDSTTDLSWVTYTNDDALPLVDAWREDATSQAEAQAAWWAAQKPMKCACQYLVVSITGVSGSWGMYNGQSGGADQSTVELLDLAGRDLSISFAQA